MGGTRCPPRNFCFEGDSSSDEDSGKGGAATYMGPCPIRHCPPKGRGLSGIQRKTFEKSTISGSFDAGSHVSHLLGKCHCTAKIRRWPAHPPEGGRHAGPRQGQIYRRFPASRTGLCLDRAIL